MTDRKPGDLPAKRRETHSEIASAAVCRILSRDLMNDPIQFSIWIERRTRRSRSEWHQRVVADGIHDFL